MRDIAAHIHTGATLLHFNMLGLLTPWLYTFKLTGPSECEMILELYNTLYASLHQCIHAIL